jgi:signal transduction histidine kinase
MIARLEGAFQNIEEAYEQQRRFVADASHELRTPLTTIKANTSLALAGRHSEADYREALQAADTAADTMNRIVQDLLLLARSDGGQLTLERLPIPLEEPLCRAVDLVSGPDAAPVFLDLPAARLGVLGESHYLTRLFVNLLENAVRHTPPDGQIVVSARAAGGTVTVRVRDDGEGIPPEHLPHVCERFYRVDDARTRARGGTGLGLAICRSIVDALDGDLAVASEVGRGTTVTVTLPAAPVPEEARPRREPATA